MIFSVVVIIAQAHAGDTFQIVQSQDEVLQGRPAVKRIEARPVAAAFAMDVSASTEASKPIEVAVARMARSTRRRRRTGP